MLSEIVLPNQYIMRNHHQSVTRQPYDTTITTSLCYLSSDALVRWGMQQRPTTGPFQDIKWSWIPTNSWMKPMPDLLLGWHCPIVPFSSSHKMIGLHTDTHLILLVFSQLATMGENVTMRGSFARKVFLFRLWWCDSKGTAELRPRLLATRVTMLQFEFRYVVVPTNPQSPHDSGPEGKGGMIWILTGKCCALYYYR